MGTKGHLLFDDYIEIYEDVAFYRENTWGNFNGYDKCISIEVSNLYKFRIKDAFLYVELRESKNFPKEFKIWGDCVIEIDYDYESLLIQLEGGHTETKRIINLINKQ